MKIIVLKKRKHDYKKKMQGESIFLKSNEKKNRGAHKLTRTPRSWKKLYKRKQKKGKNGSKRSPVKKKKKS